jgi:RNA polymerase sigma factor (sigma-70 family)
MFDFRLPPEFDSSNGPTQRIVGNRIPGENSFIYEARVNGRLVLCTGFGVAVAAESYEQEIDRIRANWDAARFGEEEEWKLMSSKEGNHPNFPIVNTTDRLRPHVPTTFPLWRKHLLPPEAAARREDELQALEVLLIHMNDVLNRYGFSGKLTTNVMKAAWRKAGRRSIDFPHDGKGWTGDPRIVTEAIESLALHNPPRQRRPRSLDVRADHNAFYVADIDERVMRALALALMALHSAPCWLFPFSRETLELVEQIGAGCLVGITPLDPRHLEISGAAKKNRGMVARRECIENLERDPADKRPLNGPHVRREDPHVVMNLAESEARRALCKYISTGVPTGMTWADIKERVFDEFVQQACMVSLVETRTKDKLPLLGWRLRRRMRDRLDREVWWRRGPGDIDDPDTIEMSPDQDDEVQDDSAEAGDVRISTPKYAPSSGGRFKRQAVDIELLIQDLTERERKVLDLAFRGVEQDEIAACCGCNQSTVSRDLDRISAKAKLLELRPPFKAYKSPDSRRNAVITTPAHVSLERFRTNQRAASQRIRWLARLIRQAHSWRNPKPHAQTYSPEEVYPGFGWNKNPYGHYVTAEGFYIDAIGRLCKAGSESRESRSDQRAVQRLLWRIARRESRRRIIFATPRPTDNGRFKWPDGPTGPLLNRWKREFGMRYDGQSWLHEPTPGGRVIPRDESALELEMGRVDECGAAMRYVVSLLSLHKLPATVEYNEVRQNGAQPVWRGTDGKWCAESVSVLGGTCLATGFHTALAARVWVRAGRPVRKNYNPA